MNPGDVVRYDGRDYFVVIDLGEKVVITSALVTVSEVKAVPRDLLFDVDPD